MSQKVFISYARVDQAKVTSLVKALNDCFVETWHDRELVSGGSFPEQINTELAASAAVIGCWSPDAVKSQWVQAEALVGLQNGSLIPVLLEPCTIPVPFNTIHSIDLRSWSGDRDIGVDALILRLSEYLKRPALREWVSLKTDPVRERFVGFRHEHSSDPLASSVRQLCEATFGCSLEALDTTTNRIALAREPSEVMLPASDALEQKRRGLARKREAKLERQVALYLAALRSEVRWKSLQDEIALAIPKWTLTEVKMTDNHIDWVRRDDLQTLRKDLADNLGLVNDPTSLRSHCGALFENSLDWDHGEVLLNDIIAGTSRDFDFERRRAHVWIQFDKSKSTMDVQWGDFEREGELADHFEYLEYAELLRATPSNEHFAVQLSVAKSWIEERFLEYCALNDIDPEPLKNPRNSAIPGRAKAVDPITPNNPASTVRQKPAGLVRQVFRAIGKVVAKIYALYWYLLIFGGGALLIVLLGVSLFSEFGPGASPE